MGVAGDESSSPQLHQPVWGLEDSTPTLVFSEYKRKNPAAHATGLSEERNRNVSRIQLVLGD